MKLTARVSQPSATVSARCNQRNMFSCSTSTRTCAGASAWTARRRRSVCWRGRTRCGTRPTAAAGAPRATASAPPDTSTTTSTDAGERQREVAGWIDYCRAMTERKCSPRTCTPTASPNETSVKQPMSYEPSFRHHAADT